MPFDVYRTAFCSSEMNFNDFDDFGIKIPTNRNGLELLES